MPEAPRSCYKAREAARQVSPSVPQAPGRSHSLLGTQSIICSISLDFEGTGKRAMACMLLMAIQVAAHLRPWLSAMLSRPLTVLSKADHLQSNKTEKSLVWKQLWLGNNLFDSMVNISDTSVWDEIIIADICMHVQNFAVKATGKCMSMLVLQKRAKWNNLIKLSDILGIPTVPKGILGSVLHPCNTLLEWNSPMQLPQVDQCP